MEWLQVLRVPQEVMGIGNRQDDVSSSRFDARDYNSTGNVRCSIVLYIAIAISSPGA